jgi:hypothetical protein
MFDHTFVKKNYTLCRTRFSIFLRLNNIAKAILQVGIP